MSVRLRLVLDQLAAPTDADLEASSREIARMLIESAPAGCVVDAIAPAGEPLALAGLGGEKRLRLGRRETTAAWLVGVTGGAEGGLIHSPTLLAPLVRHDRANDHAQTVVTVWDLTPWEAPAALPKPHVAVQQGLLRRAQRHADAVVVPTHAMAARIGEHAALGGRVRVIPGATPHGFSVPSDVDARLRDLGAPERFVVTAGGAAAGHGLAAVFAAAVVAELPVVVLDTPASEEAAVVGIAEAAGLDRTRVHLTGAVDRGDRAALLGAAAVFASADTRTVWPWRLLEAMAVATPVVAVDSETHREVVFDGGELVDVAELGDAVRAAVGEASERMRIVASDRAQAFSWHGAAEKIWQLHAEL